MFRGVAERLSTRFNPLAHTWRRTLIMCDLGITVKILQGPVRTLFQWNCALAADRSFFLRICTRSVRTKLAVSSAALEWSGVGAAVDR